MWNSGLRPNGVGWQRYVIWLAAAIVALAGLVAPAFAQTSDADATARRDRAVLAARDGDFDAALDTLRSLRAEYPNDAATRHDLVTVLAWAENDGEAVALAETIDPATAPLYTQLAVAKSARNLRRYDLAARWYDAATISPPACPIPPGSR